MNIIIFGIGEFYRKRKDDINKFIETDNIVAFLDNKIKTEGEFEGTKIYNPSHLNQLSYDKIVLMSIYKNEMREQLLSFGIEIKKILSWDEYRCKKMSGKINLYICNPLRKKKRILVLSTDLNYNGGSLAAIYLVYALQSKKYDVFLSAPSIHSELLKELVPDINVAIMQGIPFLGEKDLFWIQQFDIVVINVFQMLECALSISKIKPVLWWIHEPKTVYPAVFKDINRSPHAISFPKIHILAVSDIAQKNFNRYFPDAIEDIMTYGIPDEKKDIQVNTDRSIIFAVIAGIQSLKAQDVFLKAASLLNEEEQDSVAYWLIGGVGEDAYSKKIKAMVTKLKNAKIFGRLTRREISEIYPQIDVLVCPSWEETMSLALTEGMMHGKVCISSDYTGMAEYIVHGKNGFLFRRGDVAGLAQLMRHILRNRNNLSAIKREARRTYEENFSMETFGMRLEAELKKTEEMYYFRKNEVREA